MIFQALLGMWTVTLLVKPAIVTAHLLGGMATLKLDKPHSGDVLELEGQSSALQLEDPQSARIKEISMLAQLLEKELITPDEFTKAKKRLLGP